MIMDYSVSGGGFRFSADKNLFSPGKTFDCGQCFRWDAEDGGSFKGIVYGRALKLSRDENDPDVIVVRGLDGCGIDGSFGRLLAEYFDLGSDYRAAREALSARDPVMKKAAEASSGIHILKQDFFETVISFIISANNNIPRIKKCIGNICALYGRPILSADGETAGFAFPEPSALAALDACGLAQRARVGYRAEYIIKTAGMFADNRISYDGLSLKKAPEIERALTGLPGVGPKVANCIMLFAGLSREAFPVDVWVERLMKDLYGLDGMTRPALEKYGKDYFGEHAGLAQQFLFYYKRLTDLKKGEAIAKD